MLNSLLFSLCIGNICLETSLWEFIVLSLFYVPRKKLDEKSWNRTLWNLTANGCSSLGGCKHLFQCAASALVVLAVFPEGECWLAACGMKKCPQTRPDLISCAELRLWGLLRQREQGWNALVASESLLDSTPCTLHPPLQHFSVHKV